MRKSLIGMLLLIGAATAFSGCKDDETDKLKSPAVTITEGEMTGDNVKFTIASTDADECAYLFDTAENLEGGGIPDAATVLAEGEKITPNSAVEITKEITPATKYVVYAAAKSEVGFSEVVKCELNVPNLVEVEVVNITKSSYTFTITTDGDRAYKYTTVPAQYLEQIYQVQEAVSDYQKQRAAMRYLAWYGSKDSGTKEFTHNDNETYTEIEDGDPVEYLRELIAGMEYAIVAVGYGENNQFAANVIVKHFTLSESGTPKGKVQCELVGDAGIISAKTKCTPDANVLWYKHILIKKADRDAYIAKNGLTQYHYLVANTDSSEHLTDVDEQHYKNLSADTEYVLGLVVVDKDHNVDWQDFEFKTQKADEQSADIVITGHTSDESYYGDPWNALTFNLKSSEIVLPSKYFMGYSSLVKYLMNRGLTLEEVINEYGESFSQYNLYNINGANGYNAEFYDLKPDVEYTYAVALTNANGKVNVKSMELRTEKRTVANLSSSSLFEDLKGEWAVVVPIQEYKWETGEYQNYEYKFDVTIGNDNEFGDLCRSYNWLMCTGWAGLEYKSADDLRNDPENDGYYKEVPENLFYNFGPKWFFEIDANGNVTVPTNSAYVPCLMNYEENAPGARLAAVGSYVSSDPLPVEISSDKNTITIKPYAGYSGPEYLMLIDEGSYMAPSAKTSGDIVLTRK